MTEESGDTEQTEGERNELNITTTQTTYESHASDPSHFVPLTGLVFVDWSVDMCVCVVCVCGVCVWCVCVCVCVCVCDHSQ